MIRYELPHEGMFEDVATAASTRLERRFAGESIGQLIDEQRVDVTSRE